MKMLPRALPTPWSRRAAACAVCVATLSTLTVAPEGASGQTYARKSEGTRLLEGRNGLAIKMLVESSNLGSSEVEVGEITFPAGSQGGEHRHGSIEIFYVLSGTMDHVVNGESHVLEAGMVGIVRPEDTVSHRVLSDEPVRALVIWAPGGEAGRLATVFEERPIAAAPP